VVQVRYRNDLKWLLVFEIAVVGLWRRDWRLKVTEELTGHNVPDDDFIIVAGRRQQFGWWTVSFKFLRFTCEFLVVNCSSPAFTHSRVHFFILIYLFTVDDNFISIYRQIDNINKLFSKTMIVTLFFLSKSPQDKNLGLAYITAKIEAKNKRLVIII